VRAVELKAMNDGQVRVTSLLTPNVIERNAPQFEVTFATERANLDAEPDVTTFEQLDVIEQPGTYFLLAPPAAALAAAAPGEMFEVLESATPGASEMLAQ
jgi:hypothetical protein